MSGSSILISTQVEAAVAVDKQNRLESILGSLDAIFLKLSEFYASHQDAAKAREIDQMVSRLIYEIEAGQFSLFTDEERDDMDALTAREINEIGRYVSNLVDLYVSLSTRETDIGLVNLREANKFDLQRTFLARLLVAIDAFKSEPTSQNLIKIRALVKTYERLKVEDSIGHEGALRHCENFITFFNEELMACLSGEDVSQRRSLDRIQDGAQSLYRSLTPNDGEVVTA